MTTTTTRTITAALKKAGLPAELSFISTRNGYQYFVLDDGADVYAERVVNTCYVSDLTIAQWVEEAQDFLAEQAA